jgi:hypothetical protein
MILFAMTLAALLVIGKVEKNPGPGVEAKKILQVLCSGCKRNLKLGTQCNTCGSWFHNSCGNVKAQAAEGRKWICDKCRSESLRLLREKLQNALLQINDLTRKNKALEEQLRMTTAGREVGGRDTLPGVKVESA